MKHLDEIKLPKKWEIILVLLILSVGVFIRAFHFGISPVGVHQDEAMAAVDAKALADYGTDRFGMRWPVHFTAWIGGQMSVLLSYCMIPFIKLLGFSTFSIRLPMLVVSSIGLFALYMLGRRIYGPWLGLILLLLGVICPWHYMQSRWSFDCNMFPHVFLFGVVFLLKGLEKKWSLYVSMVFFGLCCYCYGVADYSVPLFLLAAAVLLWKKEYVRVKELILCVLIYVIIVLPEFLSMFLTVSGMDSIETPLFTIPSFLQSFRSRDILFTNFSWTQLWKNTITTIVVVWGNGDKSITNTIVKFGPIYYPTTIFFLIGLAVILVRLIKKEAGTAAVPYLILLFWLAMGFWVGIITKEVTINRINIIFYPTLATAAVGMLWCVEKCRLLALPFLVGYGAAALLFASNYFGEWTEISRTYYYDPYISALEYAKTLECDRYYITPDPQGYGVNVGEILTLYCHEIDALYYQGVSNMQDERERLPYLERYHYENVTEEILAENTGQSVVYLVRAEDVPLFSQKDYQFVSFYDGYYVISAK